MNNLVNMSELPIVQSERRGYFGNVEQCNRVESWQDFTQVLPDSENPKHSRWAIPFHELVDQTASAMMIAQMPVESMEIAVRDNEVLACILSLKSTNDLYTNELALVSAYTGASADSWAIGANVDACFNMCTFGQTAFRRRKTKNNRRDLQRLIPELVFKAAGVLPSTSERFERYRGIEFTRLDINEALLKAVQFGGILPHEIPAFREELYDPTCKAWGGMENTAFGWLMAGTQLLHKANPFRVISRSGALVKALESHLNPELKPEEIDVIDVSE